MKFIFEIFSEHIPSTMQKNAAEKLFNTVKQLVGDKISDIQTFCTTRRLVLIFDNLKEYIQLDDLSIKGPKVGISEEVIGKFCQKIARENNMNFDLVKNSLVQKDSYWYIEIISPKISVKEYLISLIKELFGKITWPTNMRWISSQDDSNTNNVEYYNSTYIRPIRSILAILEDDILDISLLGMQAANITYTETGKVLKINDAKLYQEIMSSENIVLSFENRLQRLTEFLSKYEYEFDHDMFEEIASSTECGYPFLCTLDDDSVLKRLPNKFINECVREHQQAVTIYHSKELNKYNEKQILGFALVSQKASTPHMISDCAFVLQARLLDLLFFFEEDLAQAKNNIENFEQRLNNIPMHEKLGTLKDKCFRLKNIFLKENSNLDQMKKLADASLYFKIDLSTKSVNELPSLSGYVAYELYKDILDEDIRIISLDLAKNDPLLMSKNALLLGLMDKIDTIVGFFLIGEVPTGSQDPFGLRRLSTEVVKYAFALTEKGFKLSDLSSLITLNIDSYRENSKLNFNELLNIAIDNTYINIFNFIIDRVRYLLISEFGLSACGNLHYQKSAQNSLCCKNIEFWNMRNKTRILYEYKQTHTNEIESISQIYKRITNFLKNKEVLLEKTDESIDELSKQMLDICKNLQKIEDLYSASTTLNQLFDDNMILQQEFLQYRLLALTKLHEMFASYANWDMI